MTEAVAETVVTETAVIDPVVTTESTTVVDPAKPTEAAPAEPTATIEYTDFTIPDGLTMDETVLSEYKDTVKELGLSQENAQKLIGFGAMAQAKALEKISTQWVADSTADKEFGGDKLQENLAIASKARDAFATPELKELLETSKLGNHPELIRAFYRIGKAMSEDKLVPGTRAPQTAGMSLAEKLYGI